MLLLLLFRPACACIVQSSGLSFNHEFAEAKGFLPAVVSIGHSITTEITIHHFARGDASAAIAVLESYRQQVEAKGWPDERLKAPVLQALAFHAHVEKDNAMRALYDAHALAEPSGFIRIFVDEGLTITLANTGHTLLTGPVLDPAAQSALLKKIRDLGMLLISVNYLEPAASTPLGSGQLDVVDDQS